VEKTTHNDIKNGPSYRNRETSDKAKINSANAAQRHVSQPYYCAGLTHTFTQGGKTSFDLNAALSGKDLAKLSLNGFKITNNKLVLNHHVFIGYTPLPKAAGILARK
jgi:hypothetical protein